MLVVLTEQHKKDLALLAELPPAGRLGGFSGYLV